MYKHVQICVDRQTKVKNTVFPPLTSLEAFAGGTPPSAPLSSRRRRDFERPPPSRLFCLSLPSAFFFFLLSPSRLYKITLETLLAKPTGSVRKAKEATSTRPNSHSSSPGGGRRRGPIMFMAARVQFDCLGEYKLLVSGRRAGRRV